MLRGDGEIRTLDPLLARQVLSQLSYTPSVKQLFSSLTSSEARSFRVVFLLNRKQAFDWCFMYNLLVITLFNAAATCSPMPSPA